MSVGLAAGDGMAMAVSIIGASRRRDKRIMETLVKKGGAGKDRAADQSIRTAS